MSTSNIKLKRSAVPGKIPTVGNLELGEFAVNTFDGNLFTKKNVNGTESIVTYFGTSASDSVITLNSFTGDGITTTFTISRIPKNDEHAFITINGVAQHVDTYSINNTTLTFTSAPADQDSIEVRTLDLITTTLAIRDYHVFLFTAVSDDTFSGPDDNGKTLEYDNAKLEVYVNGARLVNGLDYTATNGTTVTLLQPVSGTVEIVSLARAAFIDADADTGFTGSQGDIGFTGSQGAIGFTGSQGIQGFTGSKGIQGDTGFTGSRGESGLLEWERKISNYTAVNQDGIIADTSLGPFTITLPETPSLGDYIVIADGGDWSVNNLTIARNGSTIEGIPDDLILDVGDVRVDFVFDGTTWQVYSNVGQQGFTGSQGIVGFTGSKGDSAEIDITNDTTTNASRFIAFVDQTSGTVEDVGISDSKLFFNPSTGQLNATEFNSLSDETMKTDLQLVDDALEMINNIEGLKFKWKETGNDSLGVSAQKLETVLPELVSKNGEFKTVNYNGIIAVMIEAIKELNRKIK